MSGISLIQGQTKFITVQMLKKSDRSPIDLTTATIEAYFFKNDDSIVTLSKTAGDIALDNGPGGIFTITISSANSLTLKADERQDWEIESVVGTEVHKHKFLENLTVEESIKP